MNCPTGKPGTPAYAMPVEERLSNMARLSLYGKLNLAIEKCDPYPFLIGFWDLCSNRNLGFFCSKCSGWKIFMDKDRYHLHR